MSDGAGPVFQRVLVANRGEVAVRIVGTLRRMGIGSVVVASIPDRRSMAVRAADEWVLLEGYSAAESYLDIDAVIAAAKATGCEAIHPGYGFLSERADFAARCAAAGLVFVGPPPAVLRGMGDKAAARQLAVANGVPVVPGWDGADDDETLAREAARIGYPLMVKARGGGGGRGMREVHDPADLPEALDGARREALAAFGDGGLLLEKLVTGAHHVEVQVLADAHGHVVHLGERDCSVQRRRQKLIEETPSPVVDADLRAALTAAALRLARAVGYVNAGTFEFLVGARGTDGRRPFYFLEVNPRLQVEHPVTEMVTGLDLVDLQLRVAAGEALPFAQEDVQFAGHAIEFRINAEDPWEGFRPSGGRVALGWAGERADRWDAGYESGDTVPPQYDSLVGKHIVHGASREAVLARARASLSGQEVGGVRTNLPLQRAIVRSAAFLAGEASISWLERTLPDVLAAAAAPQEVWAAAAVAAAAPAHAASPWRAGQAHLWLADQQQVRICAVEPDGPGWRVTVAERELAVHRAAGRDSAYRVEGCRETLRAYRTAVGHLRVSTDSAQGDGPWSLQVTPPPPLPRRAQAAGAGATAIVAPLPCTVASVRVREGDAVEAGQLLLTLEAMKMEHRVTASVAGTVLRVAVAVGDVLREGDVLAEVE